MIGQFASLTADVFPHAAALRKHNKKKIKEKNVTFTRAHGEKNKFANDLQGERKYLSLPNHF